MREFRRAMHFDFHTMPGIPGLFSEFNAEAFAEKLSENHVEYINFTARCNIGFSYYDTKIGKKYPGLTRDMLKEVLDACHKRNIGVTAYINAGLNHELGADHPEFCIADRDGNTELPDKHNNFYRMMCYNTGYFDNLTGQIREILSYDIDGLFCDCMGVARGCYCPACMAKMKEKGIDTDDDQAVWDYQQSVRFDVAHAIKNIVKEMKGDTIRTYFNGVPWREDLHTHAELESLTAGRLWGHDYFFASAPYARTRFQELVFMTGRFMDDWGDFGGITTEAGLRADMYDAMMHGYGLTVGDHLHPVTGLENEVIERVGRVYAEKMLYEPFDRDARFAAEVGVIVKEYDDTYAPLYLKGISRMLDELKIPFHMFSEYQDFSGLRLLIIPGKVKPAGDGFIKKLQAFIADGGKVVFIGDAIDHTPAVGCGDYFTLHGKDPADNAYFHLGDSDMRWAAYRPMRLLSNVSGKTIADYVGNMFNYGFDGRQYYFYKPQGDQTDYATALTDGNTACISFDIGSAYADVCLVELRNLLSAVIDELLPDRFLTVENLPVYARVTVTENDMNRIVHVKTVYPEIRNGRGVIESDVWVPGGKIAVSGKYDVYTLPDMKKIPSAYENGKTVFETGAVCNYRAFSLRKA